jgi:hypothetical protein
LILQQTKLASVNDGQLLASKIASSEFLMSLGQTVSSESSSFDEDKKKLDHIRQEIFSSMKLENHVKKMNQNLSDSVQLTTADTEIFFILSLYNQMVDKSSNFIGQIQMRLTGVETESKSLKNLIQSMTLCHQGVLEELREMIEQNRITEPRKEWIGPRSNKHKQGLRHVRQAERRPFKQDEIESIDAQKSKCETAIEEINSEVAKRLGFLESFTTELKQHLQQLFRNFGTI